MKLNDLLRNDSKENLYKITKKLIEEENKGNEISIKNCMRHDAHKKIKAAYRQIKWG
ncbi:hypothetical protein [Anaerophilus nitritogenes]|uniref:hypothetical protein n=1 Tax=Anaerophilus nitritogenes TaxID=2498136 RepID=UPI0013EB0C99|nr:hypothetical protein [Anaerophilus nitritogenes]